MVGILGHLTDDRERAEAVDALMPAMRGDLGHTGAEVHDLWRDAGYQGARIHHGRLAPAPQPARSPDGRCALVLDGELFGLEEARARLLASGEAAPDPSDQAALCLALYRAHGEDLFARLDGSFVIAIHDAARGTLRIVTDRFASRPLFWWSDGRSFAFASQLAPLLRLPWLARRLDRQAVREFMTFQRVLGRRSFLEDVSVLPAATVLTCEGGTVATRRYWDMAFRPEAGSAEAFAGRFAEVFTRAVRRRTEGPARPGLLLSAGLDSRSVLGAMDGPVETFTLGDRENAEVRLARQVAEARACPHHFLPRAPDHYRAVIERAIDVGDGMHSFYHAHFAGLLGPVRDRADVVLHGHGLDYTFQGLYQPLRIVRLMGQRLALPLLDRMTPAALPERILRNAAHEVRFQDPASLFRDIARPEFEARMRAAVAGVLAEAPAGRGDPVNAWDYFHIHSIYKHFTFLNVTCIRAEMDERTVIFDNDLFDLYLAMPPRLRLGGRAYRLALERIAPDLAAIPDPKTGRRMDDRFSLYRAWGAKTAGLVRRKLGRGRRETAEAVSSEGSWPDMNRLIRFDPDLREMVRTTLRDPECLPPDLFDIPAIERHFEDHLAGRNHNEMLLGLLTFGLWCRRHRPTA